jgi:hypothetical protein
MYVILRNEANVSECYELWISLMDKELAFRVCHIETWLRFAGLASFWGWSVATGVDDRQLVPTG